MKRPALSLKAQALAMLARREHSRVELRAKLMQHARKQDQAAGPEGRSDLSAADLAAEVDALLDGLVAQGHQSDERFAESRIHARASRMGHARIQQELKRHGVEPGAEATRHLRESELERAREVWRRRYGAPAIDEAERARQARFLTGRGFSAEVVRRLVQGRDED